MSHRTVFRISPSFLLKWTLAIATLCSVSIAQVAVSVDWNNVKRTVDPLSYGVGSSCGYRESCSGNAGYRTGLMYASGKQDGTSSLVRIHTQGAMQTWSPNGYWEPAIINAALKPLVDAGFVVEINIDRAIGGNGYCITPGDAADLVRIINIDLGLDIPYWEVNNEGGCSSGGDLRNVSRAMKAVDPDIIVGGPGWFNMNVGWLTDYVRAALPDLDFVGFHEYATGGSHLQPDDVCYDAIDRIGGQIAELRRNIDQMSPDKYIPIQWNEYNLDWTWDQGTDPRVRNNKGGVLYALIMIATVDNGGDVSNIWNECQGAFGFMTRDGTLYNSAHVFHLFNQHMYGQQVTTTTADRRAVVAYATKTNTAYSLALVNRSSSQQTVPVSFPGWSVPTAWQRHQLWEDGYPGGQAVSGSQITGGITLPDNSVTILTTSLDLTTPYLQVVPGALSLQGEAGIAMPSRTIDVSNLGIGTLAALSTHVNYTQGTTGWITPVVNGNGNSQQVELQFGTNLVAGTHTAQLVVSAAGANPDSVVCSITAEITGPDVTPPTLSNATGSGTTVTVVFSEAVEQASAEGVGNYGISGGVTISGAVLASDIKTVNLTTSAVSNTGTYTLTVNNVRDRATNPNTIAANSTIPIQIIDEITMIRFYPRSGMAIRMQNGRFEGTNGTVADGPWTLLHTIANPSDQWNEVTTFAVPNPRYSIVRYYSNGGFGNVSEIEFYRGATKVAGTPFGTPGTWGGSDADYTKPWDGDVNTFFDCSESSAFTGITINDGSTVDRGSSASCGMTGEIRVVLALGSSAVTVPVKGIDASQEIALEIFDLRGALVYSIPAVLTDEGRVGVAIGSGDDSRSVLPQGQYVMRVRAGGSEGMARFNILR